MAESTVPRTCEFCEHAEHYPRTPSKIKKGARQPAFYICKAGYGSITEDELAEEVIKGIWFCWAWEERDETPE